MAWNAILMRLPVGVPLDEMPSDWSVPVIGTQDEVRSRFEQAFPEDCHGDRETCVQGDGFYVEFSYRSEPNGFVESIGVRSNVGLGAMAVMKRACDALDLRMVDCQTGQIADFSENTTQSMEDFSAWRDRVLKQREEPTESGDA